MVNFEYKPHYGWEDFLEIMHLLRGPGGCPWDREQTHSSIRRNFLEETYEVLDALDRDDVAGMKEELGDILMQVAFHSIMEEEVGRFNIDDVVDGVSKKLVFRHPHVFGSLEGKDSQQALTNWEEAKRKEKGFNSVSDAIEAVPHTLPALWRAEKIISKTVKAGFNWSSISGALDKLDEEAGEVRQAVEKNATGPHGMQEEIGDALFALTKIAQMNDIDPEEALHLACDKFEGRFRKVEEATIQPLKSYSEAELIALWEDAKQS